MESLAQSTSKHNKHVTQEDYLLLEYQKDEYAQ